MVTTLHGIPVKDGFGQSIGAVDPSVVVWADMAGWKGMYIISTMGEVVSVKSSVEWTMRPYIKRGFKYVRLWRNNKICRRSVAKLVLETFSPDNSSLLIPTAGYINGDTTDTRLVNLYWKESLPSKLTKFEAHQMREIFSQGNYRIRELALIFDVTPKQIGRAHV